MAHPFEFEKKFRIFIDLDLLQYREVWAVTGTWNDNFGVNPNDIVRAARGVVTNLERD